MAPLSDVLRLKLNLVLGPGHIRNTESTTHVLHLTGEPKHEPPRLEPGQFLFPAVPDNSNLYLKKNSQRASLTAQASMLSPKGGVVFKGFWLKPHEI